MAKHAGQRQNEALAKLGIDPIPKDFVRNMRQSIDGADFTKFMDRALPKLKSNFSKKGLTEEEQEKTLDSLNTLLLNVWMEARRTLRDGNNAEPTDDSPIIV